MDKKTPLYDVHLAAGGKIVPFAGYLLPVQYGSGVIKEHMAVRSACGLFDVSHMGEILLSGSGALDTVQYLTCNDFSGMQDGQARYSPMCNENGGIVDDILVYRFGDEKYFLVVNAANHIKDAEWISSRLRGQTVFSDVSDMVAQLALQGPAAAKLIARLCDSDKLPQKYYRFTQNISVGGISCLVSRTGYTGENGYELYCAPSEAVTLWETLLSAGHDDGLIPCGLGARDTLRLEAAMPLYGHELSDDITPLEAGLDFFYKPQKGDFIGRTAIESRGSPIRTRVGIRVTGRGIVREGCRIYSGERDIGVSTSGTHCPFIGEPVAMALVDTASSAVGTLVEADVRGRRIAAEIVPLPFYKRAK